MRGPKADPRAVVITAASDDGQAALGRAADAFREKGKADKARAIEDVAILAGVVAQMGALAGRVAQQSSTLAEEMRRGLELEGLSIPAVVKMLQTTPAGGGGTALAVLRERFARPVTERRLIATTDRAESITLVRQPWNVTVATLSELEAVAVDGEPFVTAGPRGGITGALPRPAARRATRITVRRAAPNRRTLDRLASGTRARGVSTHRRRTLTDPGRHAAPGRARLRGDRTDVDRRTDRRVAVRREH